MHDALMHTFRDGSLNPTLSTSSKLAGAESAKHASFNNSTLSLAVSMKFEKSAGDFSSNLAASPHDAKIFSLNFRIYIR